MCLRLLRSLSPFPSKGAAGKLPIATPNCVRWSCDGSLLMIGDSAGAVHVASVLLPDSQGSVDESLRIDRDLQDLERRALTWRPATEFMMV